MGLALVAAALHACWNLLLKGQRDPWAASWMAVVAAAALGLLAATVADAWRPIAPAGWAFIGASAALEVAYFAALSGAYRLNEFSLVYPLARGTVPLWVALGGVALLGERPSAAGWLGVALVVGGVLILSSRALRWLVVDVRHHLRDPGARLAALAGLVVAAYSLLNKAAVAHVPPALYGPLVLSVVAVTNGALVARRRALGTLLPRAWPRSVVIGALMIASYVLTLTAMQRTAVTYVTAAREGSIVVGAVLGWLVFREALGPRRAVGAAVMCAGIALIAARG